MVEPSAEPAALRAGRARRATARDLCTVCAGKLAIGLVTLGTGFRAVSDDDFARVVLAQRFALEPRLDPTGTSWLPAPFWLYGSVMALFGRSLSVARVLAFVLGLLSAALIYLAARQLGAGRGAAVAGTLLASVFPYSAVLGVATVPELPTAALCVFAIATTVRPSPGLRLGGAAALCAACLSRYEPWVVAVGFVLLTAVDVARGRLGSDRRARLLGALAIALGLLGPVAWLGHNALAHGDALHFLARVSAYKQAVSGGGSGETPLAAALAYPIAIVQKEPELALCALVLAVELVISRGPGALIAPPAGRLGGFGLLLVLGLSAAAVRGGAPTHHVGRALLAVWLLLGLWCGIRGRALLRASRPRVRAVWLGAALVLLALGVTILRPWYARIGQFGDREDDVAMGERVAQRVPPGEPTLLEIRDYGYFALLAGSGQPESFVLDREIDPRLGEHGSSFESPARARARARELGVRFLVASADGACGLGAGLGTPRGRSRSWILWELP